jgi:hypothetical protein
MNMLPTRNRSRREFIRELGLSATAAALVMNLPSLGFANSTARKQRLIIMISPNGTIPKAFWPDQTGSDFQLKEILSPLAKFQDRMLIANGISNRVRGDGDNHMRGMSCLLTGIELYPGNIQGGSHTPAGWASGISIDQEISNFLQSQAETKTRFGSLEFGVQVPGQADPWTRWVYAGPNKPVTPIDDPYQMFAKLYGRSKDRDTLTSILDDVGEDLGRVKRFVSSEDRRLLEDHAEFVRAMEQDLQTSRNQTMIEIPDLEAGVANTNDNLPTLSRQQIDLLVSAFRNDLARISTLQFTKSVGSAKMKWIGVDDGHHSLSHEPDDNKSAQEKLVKINKWFCGELAHLAQRLEDTPEPGAEGSMLDHTTIIWTNELGKGNSHTLNDIPFVMVGGGLGFNMGRSLKFDGVAHNRLHLAMAHAMGHRLKTFGNASLCEGGPLSELS